jgi:hypothetical protein
MCFRSGTGVRPGFEGIIQPKDNYGKQLMGRGWVMNELGEWSKPQRR